MRRPARLGSLALAWIGLASPGLAAPIQSVHVVDAGGGGDFTRIVDAVTNAADGDLVLVRDGTYPNEGSIALGTKSIAIVADAGATVTVTVQFQIANLPAGKRVLLQGLDVNNAALSLCLDATDCEGVLWLEDCTFVGFGASFFDPPDPVVLDDCDDVVVRNCGIVAGTGINGLSGGSAIRAFDTDLYVESSSLTGGKGAQVPTTLEGDVGGNGLTMEDGSLVAADSVIAGGIGGDGGVLGLCADSGDGGIGLHLTGTSPLATLRGVTLIGGDPGPIIGVGNCVEGDPGPSSVVDAGTLSEFTWEAYGFDVTSPVRSDELATATFSGPTGHSVWMGLSADCSTLFVPSLNGVLSRSAPITVQFVGALDGSGSAQFTTTPSLPPLVDGSVIYAQALFFDPVGSLFTLGAPSAVAILDPSF